MTRERKSRGMKIFTIFGIITLAVALIVTAAAVAFRTFGGQYDADLTIVKVPRNFGRVASLKINGGEFTAYGKDLVYSGNFIASKSDVETESGKASVQTKFNFYDGKNLINTYKEADVKNAEDFVSGFTKTATIFGREMKYRFATDGIEYVYGFPKVNVYLYGVLTIDFYNTDGDYVYLETTDDGEEKMFEIVEKSGIFDVARLTRR